MSDESVQKVLRYYKRLESKWGYQFITWKTKHFGYYPGGKANISEKEAQRNTQDQVAKNLKLNGGERVLDAGCGYGTTACYLVKKYHVKVVGIDINTYEIKYARKLAKKENIDDKVKFGVQDYSHTNFPNKSFDRVFTLETLSHSPNVKKTLREFYRVLKPGGKIALFEYTLAPDSKFSREDMEKLDRGIAGTAALGLKEFRHDMFPKILTGIGFKNVREENITKQFHPSLIRLKNIAVIPYFFINHLKLQKYFVNTSLAVEWDNLVNKGLIRYCIFTATIKPQKTKRVAQVESMD